MQFTLALLALASTVAAQAGGCTETRSGTFQLSIVNVTGSTKRDVERRQDQNGQLTLTLNNGVLKDSNNRVAYIASNHQFQFDLAPQPGSLSANGYCIYPNESIALHGSAIWWACNGGSGKFDNLYDQSLGDYCNQIYFQAVNANGAGSSGSGSAAPTTTAAPTTVVPTTAAPAATTPPSNGTYGNSTTTGGSPAAPSGQPSAVSTGAAALLATGVPQVLLPWALGAIGAVALL